MTEREKMLAGEMYDASAPDLVTARERAHRLCHRYNANGVPDAQLVGELIGEVGPSCHVEPPFRCDYGCNITMGSQVFVNFDCTILDCARVTIGDRVKFGPNVRLYTAAHPIDARERASLREYAKPITIEDDVWLGGGCIVLPGVRIGARSVIGAGSVVTKDIPADTVAVGNPCRVVRKIGPRG